MMTATLRWTDALLHYKLQANVQSQRSCLNACVYAAMGPRCVHVVPSPNSTQPNPTQRLARNDVLPAQIPIYKRSERTKVDNYVMLGLTCT